MDYLQPLLNEVTIMAPSLGAVIAIIIAGILLVFSGFASGSEIAFFSLTPTDLNELDEDKYDSDRKIRELRDDSERKIRELVRDRGYLYNDYLDVKAASATIRRTLDV